MNDTTTGDGPLGTRPAGETAPGQPSESPLADAPIADAPDLSEQVGDPDSVPPPDEASSDEPSPDDISPDDTSPDEAPPLPEPEANEPASELTATEAAPPPPVEPRRLSRGERDMIDRARRHFAVCGRCGYLLADLLILLGEAEVQTAMIQARDGWLRLEGDEQFRPLLRDAFGVRLDLDYQSMDGLCPECRRRFVFAALDDGRTRLRLHL